MDCACGSGKERYAEYDGHGIFLCYVCEDCYEQRMRKFRKDIHETYECDEPIDPD